MGHIGFQADISIKSHQIDRRRAQIDHGYRLFIPLDAWHAVGDQVEIHLMGVLVQLGKFLLADHKGLVEFQIHGFHNVGVIPDMIPQFLFPNLELFLSHPDFIARVQLFFQSHSARSLPDIGVHHVAEHRL